MNSNIYDRKKHSYKNRPYYCPINNMWLYPYMYMNPYTSYMVNPFMTPYMDPYMTPYMYMTPSYHEDMCSCNYRSDCEATRVYDEDYDFTNEDMYENEYEETYREKQKNKRYDMEDYLEDDIVVFNENEKNEHINKEEDLEKQQEKIYEDDLQGTTIGKKDIQLEEVNKSEKIHESKEKELYRSLRMNMRKVPLKEIID
ncbi:hypothetical protein NRP93_000034 [Clostridium botulinum]|nr:hypothetical protein [Clostridium botulinum]